MNKSSIVLIIYTALLLMPTSLIFADMPDKAATKEVRKEHIKTEHETNKEERMHHKEMKRERRKYMMLMYIWATHKY